MKPRTIVGEYDYCTADGEVKYQTVRYDPKDFRQRRPMPGDSWAWSLSAGIYRPFGEGEWYCLASDAPRQDGDLELPEVERILYRLPELLACPEARVWIVEGERKADAVADLGLVSTCNVCGAGKWQDEYSQALRGRRCLIVPDHDEPGRRHAMQVAGSLLYHQAESVQIVPLFGLREKEDVHDWLGRLPADWPREQRRQQLEKLIGLTPVWTGS